MSVDVRQFEIDRVVTMLRSFGWGLTNSDLAGDRVQVRFQKIMPGKSQEVMKFELDRIVNVLRSAGWSMVSSGFPPDQATALFEKIFKAGG